MPDPLPIVPGMTCHCLCAWLHPGQRDLCTDRYETSRPLVTAADERPLQMCRPCAEAYDRTSGPATALGQAHRQLTAVFDVIDHWLELIRIITPTALPTIRLTAAAAELLSALGADQAEVQRLLDRARATEQADPRPRAGSELADRDDTILRLARRVHYLEDELVDAWHDGHRTSEPLRDVLGMTEGQYATWASARPEQAAEAPPPEQCRSFVIQDKDGQDVTVTVLGAHELTGQGREALGQLVRAAEERFRADLDPLLRVVAEGVAERAQKEGLTLRQAAQAAEVTPAALSRITQGVGGTTYVDDLLCLASWAGLDIVAVPRDDEPFQVPPRPESDTIHTWFGLSYSNYLVLPRSLLQSMPDRWQEPFVR
ncbi:hypothetical protein FrEUN1fDRAFT_7713, partial [Parafrankia sp. EUN1f]